MSSLFSSPSKSANAAASAQQGISQQAINEAEQYVGQTEAQERGAISGIGDNPYFAAASSMNPANYAVNPNDTITFGSSGPGTTVPTSAFQQAPPTTIPTTVGSTPMIPPSSPISQPSTGRVPTGGSGTVPNVPSSPPNVVTGPVVAPIRTGGLL